MSADATALTAREYEQRIAVLVAALEEAARLVHTYICPTHGHCAGCIDITEALQGEE